MLPDNWPGHAARELCGRIYLEGASMRRKRTWMRVAGKDNERYAPVKADVEASSGPHLAVVGGGIRREPYSTLLIPTRQSPTRPTDPPTLPSLNTNLRTSASPRWHPACPQRRPGGSGRGRDVQPASPYRGRPRWLVHQPARAGVGVNSAGHVQRQHGQAPPALSASTSACQRIAQRRDSADAEQAIDHHIEGVANERGNCVSTRPLLQTSLPRRAAASAAVAGARRQGHNLHQSRAAQRRHGGRPARRPRYCRGRPSQDGDGWG